LMNISVAKMGRNQRVGTCGAKVHRVVRSNTRGDPSKRRLVGNAGALQEANCRAGATHDVRGYILDSMLWRCRIGGFNFAPGCLALACPGDHGSHFCVPNPPSTTA
jgi:hypothetical protein